MIYWHVPCDLSQIVSPSLSLTFFFFLLPRAPRCFHQFIPSLSLSVCVHLYPWKKLTTRIHKSVDSVKYCALSARLAQRSLDSNDASDLSLSSLSSSCFIFFFVSINNSFTCFMWSIHLTSNWNLHHLLPCKFNLFFLSLLSLFPVTHAPHSSTPNTRTH